MVVLVRDICSPDHWAGAYYSTSVLLTPLIAWLDVIF